MHSGRITVPESTLTLVNNYSRAPPICINSVHTKITYHLVSTLTITYHLMFTMLTHKLRISCTCSVLPVTYISTWHLPTIVSGAVFYLWPLAELRYGQDMTLITMTTKENYGSHENMHIVVFHSMGYCFCYRTLMNMSVMKSLVARDQQSLKQKCITSCRPILSYTAAWLLKWESTLHNKTPFWEEKMTRYRIIPAATAPLSYYVYRLA